MKSREQDQYIRKNIELLFLSYLCNDLSLIGLTIKI